MMRDYSEPIVNESLANDTISHSLPLFVIDASVICHQLAHRLEAYALSDQDEQLYLMASFHWIQQVGFSNYYRGASPCVVWVMDSPPYWRKSLFPEYKGSRKGPSPTVLRVKEFFASTPLPKLGFPSYEADDAASLLVRLFLSNRLSCHGIRLVTVDSDWCGMCGANTHFWESMGRSPVVRKPHDIYQWLEAKWYKQPKKWQRVWELPDEDRFYCNSIWKWKAAVGDKSDNLPPESDKGLIDLFHPPREYDLLRQREAVNEAIRVIEVAASQAHSPVATVKELESEILSLGMDMPISYIEGA